MYVFIHLLVCSFWLHFTTISILCALFFQAFPDRLAMYKYGSVFYALMFIVTYPMYLQFEDSKGWSLTKVVLHSSLATALVWLLFESWKQLIGSVAPDRGGLRPPADSQY